MRSAPDSPAGTLKLEKTTYPLKHVLAYETTFDEEDAIAVVLSGPTIPGEKIKEARELIRTPRHPYTIALLKSRAHGALARGARDHGMRLVLRRAFGDEPPDHRRQRGLQTPTQAPLASAASTTRAMRSRTSLALSTMLVPGPNTAATPTWRRKS